MTSPEPEVSLLLAEADAQEALSRRFGDGVLMVLPLESGAWAVFDSGRQLLSLGPCLPREESMLEWSQEGIRRRGQRPRPTGPGATNVTVEDLGL